MQIGLMQFFRPRPSPPVAINGAFLALALLLVLRVLATLPALALALVDGQRGVVSYPALVIARKGIGNFSAPVAPRVIAYGRRVAVCFCAKARRNIGCACGNAAPALVAENHDRVMVRFRQSERGGFLMPYPQPRALPKRVMPCGDLSIYRDCRSSASFSIEGSSFPRLRALRRMPRQAVGLK